MRMLHWQDTIDASKHHRVMDFCGDAPHTPLIGAKMSLHNVSVFLFTLVIFEFDYHSYTLMCLR